MPVALREVFAHFGITTDDRKLKQLDNTVMEMVDRLRSLGAVLTGGAVVYGLRQLVGAASDVEENMNVVSETFKENTEDVLRWANETGPAIGRSAETLKAYAGELGALLVPMIGSREEAARLSTTLSGLAVDLGSFFNRADDDVLVALRAGIVGETEPLRRLGVELTEASLNAFAVANGFKRISAQTPIAEKVQLRFAKIMADTADKQGDAARTAAGYANSEKAALETLKDLRIEAGRYLLGPATLLVQWFRKATDGMIRVSKETNLLTVAFAAAGAAVAAFAARWAIMNAGLLATVAGFAAILLLVEDLYTFMQGGTSVFGSFFDQPLLLVEALNESVANLVDNARLAWAAMQDLWSAVTGGQRNGDNVRQLQRELRRRDASLAQRPRATANAPQGMRSAVLAGDPGAYTRAGGTFENFQATRLAAVNSGLVQATATDRATFGDQIRPTNAQGGGGTRVEQTTQVHITVPPGSTREQVQHIRREVEGVLNERNRAAAAAVREQGQ